MMQSSFLNNEKCPSVLILEMRILFQPQPTEPFEAHLSDSASRILTLLESL
jgi:hypothetical protein